MKILIVEDDFVSRRLLQKMLASYGNCDIAVDGAEAVQAFELAVKEGQHYDLICLDIMMPKMNGQEVLKVIRRVEREQEISAKDEAKIIMTTALDSPQNVIEAYYQGGCTSYLVKPIEKQKLIKTLQEYGLIN
jgi:two-component system, chemotaxis family, chemotaxis protein CheY